MGRLTDSDSAGRGVLFLLREFGRLLVDAFLPGALAGALLAVTLREVSFYSGWIGVPGTALAVVALEAAVGAAVIGYCRERFPGSVRFCCPFRFSPSTVCFRCRWWRWRLRESASAGG